MHHSPNGSDHRDRPDHHDHAPAEVLDTDVLVSRLIDGEASAADRERFEHLAAAEPTLWRQLAVGQRDVRDLETEVRHATDVAERSELPRCRSFLRRLSWPLALSGWAAVFIVAATWLLITAGSEALRGGGFEPTPTLGTPGLTPEQHLQRYLAAPYVLGDMQPVVIELEELSDGRIAVHFVRRIEEVAFLDPSELPLDEDGELTSDPALLRSREPVVRLPNS